MIDNIHTKVEMASNMHWLLHRCSALLMKWTQTQQMEVNRGMRWLLFSSVSQATFQLPVELIRLRLLPLTIFICVHSMGRSSSWKMMSSMMTLGLAALTLQILSAGEIWAVQWILSKLKSKRRFFSSTCVDE